MHATLSLQVADLQYNTIANGHGPIIRYNVEELVGDYKKWSLAVEKGEVQVRECIAVVHTHSFAGKREALLAFNMNSS